ncbi:MAG TPA: RNB domain-containing ribonuclease [Pyrinomonadaceae bacterium]|nr:RNB domain-containing ribonuclease [Pyrinomonadaceae bacterium]
MKNQSNVHSIDLSAIAQQAMIDAGFVPDLPDTVLAELKSLAANPPKAASDSGTRDMRTLLWSSIDDRKSRDLDQVEYAERLPSGDICVRVGIADVDALVEKGSAIDSHAAENSTSVYTGVRTFPMLPEQLSTDMTSLVGGADRSSIVTEVIIAPDGTVKSTDVYPALLHNYAKLSYEAVGAWLDNTGRMPPEIAGVPKMDAQIRLQFEAAEHLRELRKEHGALELETIEASPVINTLGQVTELSVVERNSARDLIENFMIAANVAMAQFLTAQGALSLRRVVRTPEHWDRIVEIARELGEKLPPRPDSRALADFLARRKAADPQHFPDLSLSVIKLMGPGEYTVEKPGTSGDQSIHFGLAVHDYTHSTAPNRRFADLVSQRLVKAVLRKETGPYTEAELTAIAAHCTEREDAARKVERKMRKVGAAVLMQHRVGEVFDAIVTGASSKGTYARLIKPPVDGRIMRGEQGLRVGEKISVKLLDADPQRGFIDFGARH